jgi:hypothetical protein
MSNRSDLPLEVPGPSPDPNALGDRLVGTWTVSGAAEGETTWE